MRGRWVQQALLDGYVHQCSMTRRFSAAKWAPLLGPHCMVPQCAPTSTHDAAVCAVCLTRLWLQEGVLPKRTSVRLSRSAIRGLSPKTKTRKLR